MLAPLGTLPSTTVLRRPPPDGRLWSGSVPALAALVVQGPAAHSRARHPPLPRAFFGLHDKSMQVYSHLPFGSLRLWDAKVTWL